MLGNLIAFFDKCKEFQVKIEYFYVTTFQTEIFSEILYHLLYHSLNSAVMNILLCYNLPLLFNVKLDGTRQSLTAPKKKKYFAAIKEFVEVS